MVFDQLSNFRYFSADTNPMFWYSLTLGKVRSLRFLEKKAGEEVL